VPVPVMDVVRVWVCVGQGLVAVPVSVWSLGELLGRVVVLMMLVMLVDVGVLQCLMRVSVIVHVGRQQ
jgi:hypothetical protein